MAAIAIPRTFTSQPLAARVALTEALSSLVEVPIPLGARVFASDMPGVEHVITSWVDANVERVYLITSDGGFRVVRRRDEVVVLVFWRDEVVS